MRGGVPVRSHRDGSGDDVASATRGAVKDAWRRGSSVMTHGWGSWWRFWGSVPATGLRTPRSPWPVTPVVAIVLAMSAADHMSLADVKNRLSEVVERLEREHGRVIITKHGRPAAVVLNIEDLEGLEQTLELLSDARAMRRIRKAEAEILAGNTAELTKEQALALARRR